MTIISKSMFKNQMCKHFFIWCRRHCYFKAPFPSHTLGSLLLSSVEEPWQDGRAPPSTPEPLHRGKGTSSPLSRRPPSVVMWSESWGAQLRQSFFVEQFPRRCDRSAPVVSLISPWGFAVNLHGDEGRYQLPSPVVGAEPSSHEPTAPHEEVKLRLCVVRVFHV